MTRNIVHRVEPGRDFPKIYRTISDLRLYMDYGPEYKVPSINMFLNKPDVSKAVEIKNKLVRLTK
jgi:hypothetical protein